MNESLEHAELVHFTNDLKKRTKACVILFLAFEKADHATNTRSYVVFSSLLVFEEKWKSLFCEMDLDRIYFVSPIYVSKQKFMILWMNRRQYSFSVGIQKK